MDKDLIHDDLDKVKIALRHERRRSMTLETKLGGDNLDAAIDGI